MDQINHIYYLGYGGSAPSAAAAATATGRSICSPTKSSPTRNASTFPPASGFRLFIKPSARPAASNFASEEQQLKEDNAAATSDTVENDSLAASAVDSVLRSLEGMSLWDNGVEDPKKEMILNVIRQVQNREAQVKERKEWAQQKALQAARTELRVLRMEREENQHLKKGKQALEDTTMK